MLCALGHNCLVTQLCHPAAYFIGIDKFGVTDGSGFIPDIFHHLFAVDPDLQLVPLPAHQ